MLLTKARFLSITTVLVLFDALNRVLSRKRFTISSDFHRLSRFAA
jgi:hypothetical protein